MIELREDLSLDAVRSMITHDDIWGGSSEDGISRNDWMPIDHPSVHYIGIYEEGRLIGSFSVYPEGITSLAAHIGILKPYRVAYSVLSVFSLFRWFISQDERVNKLNAQIPGYNTGCIKLAEHAGFKHEGINRQSIMKNGKLYDQIRFGITREEAESICHKQSH